MNSTELLKVYEPNLYEGNYDLNNMSGFSEGYIDEMKYNRVYLTLRNRVLPVEGNCAEIGLV